MPTQTIPAATAPLPDEYTPEERQAHLESVFWFRKQRSSGLLEEFEGRCVAVAGNAILDADRVKHDLTQRLVADSLSAMHDEFQTRVPVYDDVSSAGNHFRAIAEFPSASVPVNLNESWTRRIVLQYVPCPGEWDYK